MSKLNLAVLIGGEWRTGFDAYPYISYYLEKSGKYNIDYFIHTYIENTFRTFHETERIYNQLSDRHIKNIKLLYNPKKIKIDTNNCNTLKYHSPPFYNFKICNDLKNEYKKETGIEYDFVLKIRPDLLLWDTPDTNFENEINLLQKKGSNYFINYFNFESNYLNLTENITLHDIYHLGNEELMNSYANIENNVVGFNGMNGVYQYKWAKENNYIPIGRNSGLHLVRYSPDEMELYPSNFNHILEIKNKLFNSENPDTVLLNDKRISQQIKKWLLHGFEYYILPPKGFINYL
jgi:hypothetical protein